MPAHRTAAEPRRFSPRHLAFVLPLVLLHLGCILVFVVGASPIALGVFAATLVIQVFGITVGYHRMLSHNSFRTGRAFRLLLTAFGVLAAQNGPLWWVGHHRHHHQHADGPGDTHSPRAGFFWSHMGWLFSTKCLPVRFDQVPDLSRIPEMRWLERNYYLVALGYGAALFAIGTWLSHSDPAAGVTGLQLVVWGSIVSTVCCYHFVWSANSVCHCFGTRRYPTPDDSRNNPLVALLTFGDGWHHNHHYYPPSARHGFRWWELDINYVVLRVLAAAGVVWDLKLPPSRIREHR